MRGCVWTSSALGWASGKAPVPLSTKRDRPCLGLSPGLWTAWFTFRVCCTSLDFHFKDTGRLGLVQKNLARIMETMGNIRTRVESPPTKTPPEAVEAVFRELESCPVFSTAGPSPAWKILVQDKEVCSYS